MSVYVQIAIDQWYVETDYWAIFPLMSSKIITLVPPIIREDKFPDYRSLPIY